MNKKVFRFYSMLLDRQEDFLNRMADDGWHLVNTTSFSYEFAPCQPKEYEYKVIFVGEKSYHKNKDYQSFLRNMGYDVITKNANLNYSIGKIRWRPYGVGAGQVATSPGSYNKELLIVGKKRDGKPFNVFNNNADFADYYRPIRNIYISLFVLITALVSIEIFRRGINSPLLIIGSMVLVSLLWPIIRYIKLIGHYKDQSKIYD